MAFKKGQSGNPGGRPKTMGEVREAARAHTKEMIDVLVRIAKSGKTDQARALAANSILDRGWGKPVQPIDGDGSGGAILVKAATLSDDELAAIASAARAKAEVQ